MTSHWACRRRMTEKNTNHFLAHQSFDFRHQIPARNLTVKFNCELQLKFDEAIVHETILRLLNPHGSSVGRIPSNCFLSVDDRTLDSADTAKPGRACVTLSASLLTRSGWRRVAIKEKGKRTFLNGMNCPNTNWQLVVGLSCDSRSTARVSAWDDTPPKKTSTPLEPAALSHAPFSLGASVGHTY
jgi:hypothetical protein